MTGFDFLDAARQLAEVFIGAVADTAIEETVIAPDRGYGFLDHLPEGRGIDVFRPTGAQKNRPVQVALSRKTVECGQKFTARQIACRAENYKQDGFHYFKSAATLSMPALAQA